MFESFCIYFGFIPIYDEIGIEPETAVKKKDFLVQFFC